MATDWSEIEQMLCYKNRVVYVNPAYLHLQEVLPLWTGGQGFKTESVRLPLHKLRLLGQWRPERSADYLGLRGWGYCAGRGVLGRDLHDP